MKIKTSELTGAALDWAVAKCEGETPLWHSDTTVSESIQGIKRFWVSVDTRYDKEGRDYNPRYSPSTDWAQGGPIIEREKIGSLHEARGVWSASTKWEDPAKVFYGKTKLIAAMRCLICAKLGDEVEVPEELCQK